MRSAPAIIALLLSTAARAEDDKRAALLARAFSYDYALKERAGDSLTVAIVFKGGNSASESSADALLKAFKALEGVKVQGLPLNALKLSWDGAEKMKAAVGMHGIDVLVVCEGLDSEVGAVRDFCRMMKIMSVGETIAYVEAGLTLGVFDTGGKKTLVVNLSAAPQENVSFSSELLRLAKVIR